MDWFGRGMALNRYDFETRLGYGLCLDWLDRPKEATKYFVQAKELNPNNARVQWKFAWHCMALRNYTLAKIWLERSLYWTPSPEAAAYLEVVNEKLAASSKPAPTTLSSCISSKPLKNGETPRSVISIKMLIRDTVLLQ